jgi:DnaK suppressor protein
MTSLLPARSAESMPDDDHADTRQRLREERLFRTEQLAALEAETPATPRHESVTQLLRTAAMRALAEIDAALARMEQGRYGSCVSCERQIDAERLSVLPMTPLCMSCHFNERPESSG